MKEHIREEPRIVRAAERQMRQWTMGREIADQSERTERFDRPHAKLGPYIALSREAGAAGGEVGKRIGERLGWEVLDKKLVEQIAERSHLPQPMLELVDETGANWAYDILGPWLDRRIISHEKFVVHLGRIIVAAARRGNVVLVGRGASFLLPRDQGLAARIVASEKFRIERLIKLYGFDEARARQYMLETDRGRREFVSKFFHRDIEDPHWFDITLATDRLGIEGAADLIVAAYQHRCAG